MPTTDRPDLDAIEARYKPEPPGPCHICGAPLVVGEADAFSTTWACPGGDWSTGRWAPFMPGRTLADDHYARSQTTTRPSDPSVVTLTAYVRALEQERDAAQALLAEQQRAFVIAVEAMEARRDAEIAGIVQMLRDCAKDADDYAGQGARELTRAADSIATTHAAALARHAGRNTTAEVPRG